MSAYLPTSPSTDDHQDVRNNGMWYRPGQSGYADILKRGFPKPRDRRTILAELHSPLVPSFLHGGTAETPFLVTDAAREALEAARLTGFSFLPVVVAKLATAISASSYLKNSCRDFETAWSETHDGCQFADPKLPQSRRATQPLGITRWQPGNKRCGMSSRLVKVRF
jgi:hypothetical protein